MNKPDKIRLGTRGRYLTAAMPERTGRFIAEELVAELRRGRPKATLTTIAGEYGESERNFRRYLKGKSMPLGKGRRFARRLADLHIAAVIRLRALSALHPKQVQARQTLGEGLQAFNSAYTELQNALDEAALAVDQSRLKIKASRQRTKVRTVESYKKAVRPVEDRAPFRLERFAGLIEIGLARVH